MWKLAIRPVRETWRLKPTVNPLAALLADVWKFWIRHVSKCAPNPASAFLADCLDPQPQGQIVTFRRPNDY